MVTKEQIEQLREVVAQKQHSLSDAKADLHKALTMLSEQMCPHKIGDVIEIRNRISHRGKKLLIEGFAIPSWGAWRVVGSLLKKDGSVSAVQSEEYGEYNE